MSRFRIVDTGLKTVVETDNSLIWRSYNGNGNNLYKPEFGKGDTALLRKSFSDYADGISTMAQRGASNPSPRVISNSICATNGTTISSKRLTDMCWGWGQFVDHELDLTGTNSAEPENVLTSALDPNETYPNRTIVFDRSNTVINTSPREQPNHISAFLDATNVYGASPDRCYDLRLLDGTGKMKTGFANNSEVIFLNLP